MKERKEEGNEEGRERKVRVFSGQIRGVCSWLNQI